VSYESESNKLEFTMHAL